jgi:sugar phosphate permease
MAFGEAIKSLTRGGSFWLLAIYWGLLGVAGWVIGAWMPTYLNEEFHLGQGAAGLSATGYLQVAALVGVLVGGVWADRWSRTNRRGPILVPALGLCLAAPAMLLAASSSWLFFAILGLCIYGFTRAFADANMMPILCLVTNERYRATGYGVLNLVASLAGGVGVFASGALRDRHVGLTPIFVCIGFLLAGCIVLLLRVRPAGVETQHDAALVASTTH